MTRNASVPLLARRVTLIALALVAALAVLATTADRLDRLGRLPPALGWLLVGEGARAETASRLGFAGQVDLARVLALAAVKAEPGNQLAVRALGLADIARGDATRGEALMRAAGSLGWRDPPTQAFWANVAWQAGDFAVAAQRLDAVMRTTEGSNPAVSRLVVGFEAIPEGRAALATRMLIPNNWSSAYLADLNPLGDAQLDDRAALTAALALHHAPIAPWAFVAAENMLVTRGHAKAAFAVRNAIGGGRGAAGMPANGEFERPLLDPPSVFDWRLGTGDALETTISAAPAPLTGLALHVRSTAAATLPIAEQYVVLARGTWRLEFSLVGNQSADPILVLLLAQSGAEQAVTPLSGTQERRAWHIRVEAPGEVQLLRLLLTSEEASRSADLWVDRVTLIREGGPQ